MRAQDWQDRDQEKRGEGEYKRTAILTIEVQLSEILQTVKIKLK